MVVSSQTKLVNQVKISRTDIQDFKEQGFLKIKNLLTPEAIRRLREITLSQIAPPVGEYADSEVAQLKYGIEDPIVKEIYSSEEFNILNELAQQRLLFLQGVGFQMEPEKKGFDWHVGVISFNFIRPEDFACSLWIPLDPIDTHNQHGGMCYVPTNISSAESYFSLVYKLVKNDDFIQALSSDQLKRRFDIAPEMDAFLLEKTKVEDDFQLGDVLLFDKFVWHRSCTLKQGELPSRSVFVMRFTGEESRYSKTFFNRLNMAMNAFNSNTQSDSGSEFRHLNDGDFISESNLRNQYVGKGYVQT